MSRRKKPQKFKQALLFIVCGKTEKIYINSVLKRIIADPSKKYSTTKLDIEIFRSENMKGLDSVLQKIEQANKRNHYTQRFIVMDLEGDPKNNQPFYNVYNDLKYHHKQYTIITSLPSIEVWFLLHLKDCKSSFENTNKVIEVLNTYPLFDQYNKEENKNLTTEQIEFLVDNYEIALTNNQYLERVPSLTSYYFNGTTFHNPHTQIPQLIDNLKSQ